MDNFGLVKSFGIDNGELDNIPQHECFVLGYELGEIDTLLKFPAGFRKMVHAENVNRIIEACHDAKRHCNLNWLPGDVSETWLQLDVQPMEISEPGDEPKE